MADDSGSGGGLSLIRPHKAISSIDCSEVIDVDDGVLDADDSGNV